MTTITTRATDAAREQAGDALVCVVCGKRIAIHGELSWGMKPGEPIGMIGLVPAHTQHYEEECARRANHVHTNE